jgi:hypothetical protein
LENIIFIGNARDYHAIDWYRNIKKICSGSGQQVLFATDLICSEGHTKLISDDDILIDLYNIDWLLFTNQSAAGNIWRNIVKVVFFPIQVRHIKKLAKKYPGSIFHAHTMYYLFLGWMARLRYIGSPQGSEILVRPYRSKIYRYFAKKSLMAAEHIIIDSVNLQNGILKLCGKQSTIIQYGIDVKAINKFVSDSDKREYVVSIRGLYPIYQIEKIFHARDFGKEKLPLILFYPFWEDGYKAEMLKMLKPGDQNLGRIPEKKDVFKLLSKTILAVSIPLTDSSPRSVYEAIFCGCCVAVTYNPWIDSLPECMRERVIVVDLDDVLWLEKAIAMARLVTQIPFKASEIALRLFDQEKSMQAVAELFYQKSS